MYILCYNTYFIVPLCHALSRVANRGFRPWLETQVSGAGNTHQLRFFFLFLWVSCASLAVFYTLQKSISIFGIYPLIILVFILFWYSYYSCHVFYVFTSKIPIRISSSSLKTVWYSSVFNIIQHKTAS